MLQRRTTGERLVYYASPLLESAGVPHAFSTRLGGISPPPFDSLNLGNPSGCEIQDDYERIWENYRLLQSAAGCVESELCRVHQVHGPVVVRAVRGEAFDVSQKADALVTDDPARVLSVRIADCVPILLASKDGRCVAAVHAGWRGVIAGVLSATISELNSRYDVQPRNLLAAIGPCIGFDAFEVGPEVLSEFRTAFGADAPIRADGGASGKRHVDLRRAVQLQLNGAGIDDDRIDPTDRCTFRDTDEFFSHRRGNGIAGRLAAIIGVSPGVTV